MQAFTGTARVRFVTGETSDVEDVVHSLRSDGLDITVSSREEADSFSVQTDCLLVSDALTLEEMLTVTRTVRRECPSVPVVAFTTGAEGVDALFEAGATDVVPSSVTETPPSVIRRRIESALVLTRSRSGRLWEQFRKTAERGDIFRQVTENISDVVWVNSLADGDGLEYVNAAYEQVWGRSVDSLYEDRNALLETVHPEDRDRVRQGMDRQLENPESYDLTYRIVRPDGDVRWVHSRAFGVREEGELERIVGLATDITEREQSQQQLEAERDLVEHILETSPVGIAVIDTDGRIARANEQAATILSVPRDELEGGCYSPEGIRTHSMDGTELKPAEFPFNRIRETCEPLRDEQFIIETASGENSVISVDGVPLFDDGTLTRVVITFDDVTSRVEREKRLEHQRDELAQLDHINRIIRGVHRALLDSQTRGEILQQVCNRLTDANQYRFAVAFDTVSESQIEPLVWTEGASELGVETAPAEALSREECLGMEALTAGESQIIGDVETDNVMSDLRKSEFREASVSSLAMIPVIYGGVDYGVIGVYGRERDAFGERESAVLDELGETVGHAIAAVESREREETLTSLYRATEGFLAAETPQDVTDVVVDTAADVLDLSDIGIFLFDDRENLLSPVAATETFLDVFGEPRIFGPDRQDSITWHTYVTGERQRFTDVRESDRLANPDTAARAVLMVPLGEYGVFVATSTERGFFDDAKSRLVELLAATTEAALDRVAGEVGIRERDEELEEQAQRLKRFEQLLSLTADVNRLLREADTRTEIQQELCERLVEEECLSFAWIGHVPPSENEVEPRTWTNTGKGYLDVLSLGESSSEPAVRAAKTGETAVVPNVTEHIRDAPWAREALDRGFQSVLTVPFVHDETSYGVVTVYATEPETFTGETVELAEGLCATVAHGINSVETRRAVLGDRATELELYIPDAETVLNAVATVAGEPVEYQEITPIGDQQTQILFTLSDPPVEEVLALESVFVTVESLTHTRRGENHLFRVTVSGEAIAGEILGCGGIPHQIEATDTGTQVTVRLARELGVREFVDRFRKQYPGTELRSRQDIDRLTTTPENVQFALDDLLTLRQREVLVTAYESGFFQSPRETTGEELATLLGVSQPTVTHHLREAQHRILAALLEPTDE